MRPTNKKGILPPLTPARFLLSWIFLDYAEVKELGGKMKRIPLNIFFARDAWGTQNKSRDFLAAIAAAPCCFMILRGCP